MCQICKVGNQTSIQSLFWLKLAGGGHDGGQGGDNVCQLQDGRKIPLGQDFPYTQNGVDYICTCTASGGQRDVECRKGK